MSLEDIIARNKRDRAAGVKRTYPQHAGKAKPRAPGVAQIAAKATAPRKAISLPCVHVGPDSGPAGWHYCEHPNPDENPKIPSGDVVCGTGCNGKCTARCPGYATAPRVSPPTITRIDPTRLAPVKDGRLFNCSMLDFAGKRLLAYRTGWTSSRIHVATLGDDFQPTATVPVELRHPRCAMGQEDPRLFLFDGAPHLIFAGLEWSRGRMTVSQMIAELDSGRRAVRVWEPRYAKRTHPMEKNWMPFERDGELYCVYQTRPHRVLSLDPLAGTATLVHESAGPPANVWPGWELRGGAPPVRVGDEYYSFFHGWKRSKKKGTPHGDWYDYAVGVYTFDASTFVPRRIGREPLWLGDPAKLSLNVTRDKSVIYPGGAVLDGARWLVAAGHQDAECVIGEFAVADIERALEAV